MTMGLLKSTDSTPGIDYHEYRDNQYYGKYEYRLRINIGNTSIMYVGWCKNVAELEALVSDSTNNRWPYIPKAQQPDILSNLDTLKTLITFKTKHKKTKDALIRVEYNTAGVYSNDLALLKQLEIDLGTKYTYDYTQVQAAVYAGVKYFVHEPKHKYRIYLKSKKTTMEFRKNFKDMIARMPSLYPSSALSVWLSRTTSSWPWSSAMHYIDYDDEATLSYLSLMHDGVFGKRYKLEKRPDPT